MTLHIGKKYIKNNVMLGSGNIDKAKKNNLINYTDNERESWRKKAVTRNDIYYFSIYYKKSLIGEIFLHDINKEKKEALIGYHIFNPDLRGKGIGSISLGLLQDFVKELGELKKLTIITGKDNLPSIKITEKCNFKYTGPSWEDPKMVTYEWVVK